MESQKKRIKNNGYAGGFCTYRRRPFAFMQGLSCTNGSGMLY